MTLRSRFFAMTYDHQMTKVEKAGLRAYREGLLAGAAGQVLEIGAGTGSNLRFYGPAVESLTLTEPETPMLRRLERKVGEQAPDATVLRAPAEDLPFEDATFDVAVSILVLCGVDDQPRALRELRRVLRPGGELLFIVHVRSGDTHLARSQEARTAGAWPARSCSSSGTAQLYPDGALRPLMILPPVACPKQGT
jgi:ubiquinone/menaquinone biosynthesis C-methylase UbiE